MKTIIKGEKRTIGVSIESQSGPFEIAEAEYQVLTEDRETVVDEGTAVVSGSRVSMLLDSDLLEAGEQYVVYFWVRITDLAERINGNVMIRVIP